MLSCWRTRSDGTKTTRRGEHEQQSVSQSVSPDTNADKKRRPRQDKNTKPTTGRTMNKQKPSHRLIISAAERHRGMERRVLLGGPKHGPSLGFRATQQAALYKPAWHAISRFERRWSDPNAVLHACSQTAFPSALNPFSPPDHRPSA